MFFTITTLLMSVLFLLAWFFENDDKERERHLLQMASIWFIGFAMAVHITGGQ